MQKTIEGIEEKAERSFESRLKNLIYLGLVISEKVGFGEISLECQALA